MILKTIENILLGAALASGVICTLEKNTGVENPNIAYKTACLCLVAYVPLTIYKDYKIKE